MEAPRTWGDRLDGLKHSSPHTLDCPMCEWYRKGQEAQDREEDLIYETRKSGRPVDQWTDEELDRDSHYWERGDLADEVLRLRKEMRLTVGPFQLGSTVWPGLGKVMEEMGELGQVLGKLIATGGSADHWDGAGSLDARAEQELADLQAALHFFIAQNFTIEQKDFMDKRIHNKVFQFNKWHQEALGGELPSGEDGTSGRAEDHHHNGD